MPHQLTDEISRLEPGGHLCLLYEKDPAEQMPALVPFIRDGLAGNEQFIYIADDQTVEELADHLSRGGVNVSEECQSGRLKLCTRNEWRQPGELDSARKAQQVRQLIAQAERDGFKGIRFAVEMTWTLGPNIDSQKLEHWEATINTLFEPSFPGRIVCQYNRNRLDPDTLLAALHTHPAAIIGQTVCPNPFFQAPLILNGSLSANGNGPARHATNGQNGNGNSKADHARIEWMIGQLQRAHQAEQQKIEAEVLRRRNEELKRSQAAARFLAAVVESSDDAIITKDLNGTITSWNRAAERIFGYTPQEAIGQPVTMLIPNDRHEEEPEILSRLRRGQRIDHYETIRCRKDGALLDISLTVSPVRGEDGNLIGASKIARDITDRKRAERELRETKEQLALTNDNLEQLVAARTSLLREAIAQMEEFSYSVSHDLRAPVRAMHGYAQVILEEYGDRLDARGRDYLDRILRGSARMQRLIHDVLTFSRLARCEISLQPVSLEKLIPDIIQQYPEMQPPLAEIILRRPLHAVQAHEPSLVQAISNLLSNAVKFVTRGTLPTVQVWTEMRNGTVRLWIEDNGIGIKPEYQRRLFGMFERIHTDKTYEGTGIGLAIVRKAVERMGGTAGVESDGMTGSNFWIELPSAAPQ